MHFYKTSPISVEIVARSGKNFMRVKVVIPIAAIIVLISAARYSPEIPAVRLRPPTYARVNGLLTHFRFGPSRFGLYYDLG